jgi:hypothetical protein
MSDLAAQRLRAAQAELAVNHDGDPTTMRCACDDCMADALEAADAAVAERDRTRAENEGYKRDLLGAVQSAHRFEEVIREQRVALATLRQQHEAAERCARHESDLAAQAIAEMTALRRQLAEAERRGEEAPAAFAKMVCGGCQAGLAPERFHADDWRHSLRSGYSVCFAAAIQEAIFLAPLGKGPLARPASSAAEEGKAT